LKLNSKIKKLQERVDQGKSIAEKSAAQQMLEELEARVIEEFKYQQHEE